jgi:hypothetical protein
MIDPQVFARYMIAIADRIKSPLSDATNALYYVTLSEKMTTQQFEDAAREVFATYSGFAFPSLQTFLDNVSAPLVDVDYVLRRIHELGEYNAQVGWVLPSLARVRESFGPQVAEAYALAGAGRCYADTDTTRDIARREFGKALEAAQAKTPNQPLLGSVRQPLLPSGAPA